MKRRNFLKSTLTLGGVAAASAGLASKASDYVNGYILTVDGGWMAR